jgi:uncharacterized protein involved in exopolysaccharide biosynthesis
MSFDPHPHETRGPAAAPRHRALPVGAPEPEPADYVAAVRPYLPRAAAAVAIGTLLAVLVAFLWPPTYVARATLLPPTEEDTGFSVSNLLRGIAVPGIRIPTRSGPADVTVSILESRRIAEVLVRQFDLRRAYGVGSVDAAIAALQDRSRFDVDEMGMIVIAVEDRDPKRAADLANAFARELDRFNREVRMTKGRRMRLFVETRLDATRRDLAAAEARLRDYARRNRTVPLSAEQMSMVESGAQLFAQKAALEVQVGVARGFAAESSEEVRRLRQQLEQVNRQIGALPELGVQMARLVRDIRVHEQVYALLSAQHEEARINEARDLATVEVLDEAVPPERRAWPRRGLLVAIGFVASVLLSAAWIGWSLRRKPHYA